MKTFRHTTQHQNVVMSVTVYSNLTMFLENEKQLNLFEKRYNISGLLRHNYMTPYLKSDKNFIYMDHEEIERLAIKDGIKPCGYTVFAKDLDTLEKINKELLDKCFKVNNSFQKGSVLKEIQNDLKKTRITIVSLIVILSTGLLILLFHYYANLRKKEFALLKVNGLGQKDILKIIMKELLHLHLYGYLIPSFILIIMIYLLAMTPSISMYLVIYLTMMIQFIVTYMINRWYISRLSPENILRN